MANAATLNVSIEADTARFHRAMGQARHELTEFKLVAAELTVEAVKLGAELAHKAVEGVYEFVKGSMEAIEKTTKLSEVIGTNVTHLMALQDVAEKSGSSANGLSNAMEKFVKTLGGAEESLNGGSAAKALQMLGLSMDQLARGDKSVAVEKIAKAMQSLTNSTERAFIETSLFGKGGQELDLTLRKLATEGLDAVTEASLRTGEALLDVDAYKVVLAGEALKEVNGLISGIGNTLAVELAPYIEAATQKFLEMANEGGGMGKVVVHAFEYIVKAIAQVADYVELLEALFYSARGIIVSALNAMLTPLKLFAEGLDYLMDKTERFTGQGSLGLGDFFKGLELESKEAFDKAGEHFKNFEEGINSKHVAKVLDEIAMESNKAAEKMAAQARKRIDESMATEFKAPEIKVAETKFTAVKEGAARAIDTANISVEGLARQARTEQIVKDPESVRELRAANEKLERLIAKQFGGNEARTSP